MGILTRKYCLVLLSQVGAIVKKWIIRFIITLAVVSVLFKIGTLSKEEQPEDVAVILYEYKADSEVIVNGKVFTIVESY